MRDPDMNHTNHPTDLRHAAQDTAAAWAAVPRRRLGPAFDPGPVTWHLAGTPDPSATRLRLVVGLDLDRVKSDQAGALADLLTRSPPGTVPDGHGEQSGRGADDGQAAGAAEGGIGDARR